MNTNDYIAAAADTNKAFPHGLTQDPVDAEILHATMGFAGEAAELVTAVVNDDRVNIVEELGDAAFFLAIPSRRLGVDADEINRAIIDASECNTARDALDAVIIASGDLIDHVKRTLVYGKEPNADALAMLVLRGWHCIAVLARAANIDFEDTVLPANREKLAGRYKGGYSDTKALNRDTDAERETLEQAMHGS